MGGAVPNNLYKINGVNTNTNNSSVPKLQKIASSRGLTSGEITMLKLIFGNHIDYFHVQMYKGELIIQPDGRAMTPMGGIHWPEDDYVLDYANPVFNTSNPIFLDPKVVV
jgi:hypothetical protein